MTRTVSTTSVFACFLLAAGAAATGQVVTDFEDLAEGAYGIPFTHDGITFRDLNNVSGVFPSGEKFGPQLDDEVIIEDATFFYNDNPGWGSADKTLTFGIAYVPGDNLSLGRVSTVSMDLPETANAVSVDIAYYEDGPWGGIEYHLDAIRDGLVVGTDGFVLSDLGGRDTTGTRTLAISGVEFDELHLYATFGSEFSMPRVLLDDLTLTYVNAAPSLSITGTCPGQVQLDVTGATSGGTVAFVYASGPGSVTIPSGVCAGTQLGLNASARLINTVTADGNGDATLVGNAPAVACGGVVQALDVSTCTTTNVVGL